MWTDGQTNMTKLIVAFRNFANTPKTFIYGHILGQRPNHIRHNADGYLQSCVRTRSLFPFNSN